MFFKGYYVRYSFGTMKYLIFSIVCVKLLGESAVCGVLVNVALKKTAEQSSTDSYEGRELVPSLAVDGVKNQHVGSCSQTQRQNLVWWRIDLDDMYNIYKITIYSRNDSYCDSVKSIEIFSPGSDDITNRGKYLICNQGHSLMAIADRLSDFKISTSNDDITFVTCYSHDGVFPSVPTDVSCRTIWPKRYIKIKLESSGRLSLCEVEIYVEREVESSSTVIAMTTEKGLSPESKHVDESTGRQEFKELTSTVMPKKVTSQELKSYELISPELRAHDSSRESFLEELSSSPGYLLAFQESFSPEPTSSLSYLRISKESFSPELTISHSKLLVTHESFYHNLTSDQLVYQEPISKETTSQKDVRREHLPTELLSDELISTTTMSETLPYESSRRSSQETGDSYLLPSSLLTDGFKTTKLTTNPLSSNSRLMLPTQVLHTNTVLAPSKVNVENTLSHLILETNKKKMSSKSELNDFTAVIKTKAASTLNLLTIPDHLIGSYGSSVSHVFTYDIDKASSIEGNENFISLSGAPLFDSKETNRPQHMTLQLYITSTLSSPVSLETTELLITPTKYEAPLLCSRRCKEIVLSEQLQKYKDDLTLEKTSLSKYVRTKTSADNKNALAKIIGWPGVVIFSVLVFFIILSDLPTLFCGHRRISRK